MGKTCDLCGARLGVFRTFHCLDGTICKTCYRIVSGNYTSTVAGRSLAELKRLYVQNAAPLDLGEAGFQATRRVGSFLLLDDAGRRLCILNNRRLTRQNSRPELFPFEDLEGAALVTVPPQAASAEGGDAVVERLAVDLAFRGAGRREIVIIPSPVRASGFAYHQGRKTAERILACLESILSEGGGQS